MVRGSGAGPAAGALLERSRELATLVERLTSAQKTSHGHFAFVSGEAGVGKTALLRAVSAAGPERTRVLWGACDPMFTPQALGPLLDVTAATGGDAAELVAAGAKPHPIATALLRELAAPAPTLVLIEDLHWADEATLDVMGLVARRIGSVPALVLASYRDDELDRRSPLRILLGELATAQDVSRLHLERLSSEAVATLAQPHGVDADALYRTTGGNAFFVTEVLAGGHEQIPATVRDAVLARTARLSPEARNLLDAAAVLFPPIELAILGLLAPDPGGLEECLTAGILVATEGGVAFRHELSRLAIEESLAPDLRIALHGKALAALADSPGRRAASAHLAHHAERAGDADAVLRFAPAAASVASAAGAHREAAAQYDRALRFAGSAPPRVRAELLDRRTAEYSFIGEFREAIASGRQALEGWELLGERREVGRALTALAWPLWVVAAKDEADRAAESAVAVLEPDGPSPELVRAYLNLCFLARGRDALEDAVGWGNRALEVAEQMDDRAGVIGARAYIAGARALRLVPGAREELEDLVALARREGFEAAAANGYGYLASAAVIMPDYGLAASYLEAGIDYCTEHDLGGFRPYMVAMRSSVELARGQWPEAAETAGAVLAGHGLGAGTVFALAALGRLRARRGDPGQWDALDEALRLAKPSREIWRVGPVAVARAEAAWLEGRFDAVIAETDVALELTRHVDLPLAAGELALWRWRAGLDEPVPPGTGEPYAMQMAGDWQAAGKRWSELGAPYEAALALADGDDEDALRQALSSLQQLGAAPAAAIVARRLRSQGARDLPRGPRRRTRENPANLTPREMEVLALVADGLGNADIAETLFLSKKTVSHHVSAILQKLGVKTRGEAGAAYRRLTKPPHGSFE